MGKHHGGDSGNPPDGDHQPDEPVDLPELPPEWGDLTIPDDPSELAAEAEQVRRELAERRAAEAGHPSFGFFRSRSRESAGERQPSVGGPLLIMSMAVLITLISLFAMAWSGSSRPTGVDPEADPVETLPQVTLTDADGSPVALTAQAPVAILLIEECTDCANLVAATAAAAPPGVAVAAVGHSPPPPPPGLEPDAPTPLLLGDPYQVVRASLALAAPTNAATVVLVNADQQVTHTFPTVTAIGQFQAELGDLAP